MDYENILVTNMTGKKMCFWQEDYSIRFTYVAFEIAGLIKLGTSVWNIAFDFKTCKLLLTFKMAVSSGSVKGGARLVSADNEQEVGKCRQCM